MDTRSDINIRFMSEEDLSWVTEVENRCFPDPWLTEAFEAEINQNDFSKPIVALLGDKRVGYAVPRYIADELEITNFAVDPDFRRMNVGSMMLGRILSDGEKRDVKYGYLEVRVGNLAAIKLYKKFGFNEVGLRKNYYSGINTDAIIMMKNFS
ncbi:MAG: ribosomal protein S18-alanine N-acetyltransferase [Candidatus Marinimicrobia bacterium]|nr:ribosomal protein S18-alanine N-acetyltransferase [Candidatus Neomarinimicrobiota bacterium]